MPRTTCRRRLPLFRACALLLACALPAIASAGGPANDDWAARQVIPTLPFSDIEGAIGAASTEGSDPAFACRRTAATPGARSVWYSYTTGSDVEYVNLSASGFDALLAVYAGDATDGFELVTGACNDDGGAGGGTGSASLVGVRLQPDTEYSIEVATWDAAVPATLLQFTIDRARTYNVTKTADTNDGSCDADCSLREAVRAANQTEGVVIVPAGTYVLTITGADDVNATGDLDVLGATGIYGAGTSATIIDGNADVLPATADRLLQLDPAGSGSFSFALADLTLRDGSAANGGALANIAVGSTPDFIGLSNVRIMASVASAQGGGARLDGVAVVDECTLDGNRATLDGGGIASVGTGANRLRIQRSTLNGNTSQRVPTGGGGGVFLSGGVHAIDTATFSANSARAGGGGVLVTGTAQLTVANATIVDNRSDAIDTSGVAGGGLRHESSGVVAVASTIIAGNRRGSGSVASDCARAAANALQTHDDLVQAPDNCTFTGTNDVTNVAAGLGPLAANGGPTATHLPLAGSPVVDAGAPTCGTSDQRGAKRPSDGDGNGTPACDRGAVEVSDALLFKNGFE